jgi:hypothetical protein
VVEAQAPAHRSQSLVAADPEPAVAAALVRTRLKRMQYRPDLLDGFVAQTGLITTLP